MKKAEVRKEVIGLIGLLDDPKHPFVESCSLKSLFDYLRTMIKYSRFDLEATRRELKGKK